MKMFKICKDNIYKTFMYIFIVIIVYIFVSVITRYLIQVNIPREHSLNNSLFHDGYVLLDGIFDEQDIHAMRRYMKELNSEQLKSFLFAHEPLKQKLQQCISSSLLPAHEYEYQDYILLLNKSQIHTCHRDYNGDLYHKTKFPSFTLLIYLYDMDSCLDIIEKSHKHIRHMPYITDISKHITCGIGDVLIFNSNLIHAGSVINKTESNPRIQMKFTHNDDRNVLSFYENYTKVIDDENHTSNIQKHFIKHTTCQHPFLFEFANNVTNGMNFKPPAWYTNLIYGNSNFFSK